MDVGPVTGLELITSAAARPLLIVGHAGGTIHLWRDYDLAGQRYESKPVSK